MELRCPTCRAFWRGVSTCGRCGADLTIVMQVAVKAWELREAARRALCDGDRPAAALRLARAAQQLHITQPGQRLLALALFANHQIAEAYAVMEQLVIDTAGGTEASPSPSE